MKYVKKFNSFINEHESTSDYWDEYVGNQTPEQFMKLAGTDDIEDAVITYVDDMMKDNPEWDWENPDEIKHELIKYIQGVVPYKNESLKALTEAKDSNPEKKVTKDNVVDYILKFEGENMEIDDLLKFFSYLIKSDLIKSLQGNYGRTAKHLMDKGFLDKSGKINWSIAKPKEEKKGNTKTNNND